MAGMDGERPMLSEIQKELLQLTGHILFDVPYELPTTDSKAICEEAFAQAVLPLVFPSVEDDLSEEARKRWKNTNLQIIINNVRVENQHREAHILLTAHQIPYVILKGCASAHYYPSPIMRSMGDVDFLVREEDMKRVGELLKSEGFKEETEEKKKEEVMHIAYHRAPRQTWEVHRFINGIPKDGAIGNLLNSYCKNILETSVEINTLNGCYRIPDTFHHGLVLLLHTASHLTSAGVGLRHLCDWAVFYASLSEEEFVSFFEEKLKAAGLWRFAQLLTLTAVTYLKSPARIWAGTADEDLLESIITDILTGGNFGRKDHDRSVHDKFIRNRDVGTIDGKAPLAQMLYTVNVKARTECGFVKKCPALQPIGWVVVAVKYTILVLAGKRKFGNRKTLDSVAKRKNIYKEFHLFEAS